MSAVEAARGARERGLKAIVLKGGAFETVTAMNEVLALCAKHDLVLETCHLAPQEALALIREAKAAGVQKIVCTHADYDPINMSIDEQREAARLGAFIEHAYIGVFRGPQSSVPRFQAWRGATVEQMAAAVKAVAPRARSGQRHGGGAARSADQRVRGVREALGRAGHQRRAARPDDPHEPVGAPGHVTREAR